MAEPKTSTSPAAPEDGSLSTLAEAASALRIHPDTLRRYIVDDGCPALPVGGLWRVSLIEVTAWLRSRGPVRRGRKAGSK